MNPTVLLLAVVLPAVVQAGWAEDFNDCTKPNDKYTVSQNDLDRIKRRESPTTTAGKCALACLMKKIGLMTANGQFAKDQFKHMAPLVHMGDQAQINIANQVADFCASDIPKNLDECETAGKIDQCITQKGNELGMKAPQPPIN